MPQHNLSDIVDCITRLHGETASSAIMLLTAAGRLLTWRGQGTQAEAAELGASVARIVQRGGHRAIPPDRGPVYWYTRATWILVICDKRGMQSTSKRKMRAELQATRELEQLLPDDKNGMWASGFRWDAR